jgi:hypothetical protein
VARDVEIEEAIAIEVHEIWDLRALPKFARRESLIDDLDRVFFEPQIALIDEHAQLS